MEAYPRGRRPDPQEFQTRMHDWQVHAEDDFVMTIFDAAGNEKNVEAERKHRHDTEEALFKEFETKLHEADKQW